MKLHLFPTARWLALIAALTVSWPLSAADDGIFNLNARSRVELPDGQVKVITSPLEWNAARTAVVVCDMWDQHWCEGATRRVAEMAPRMNEVVKAARERGALIIHCPSDTMSFYKDWPQRKLAQSAPEAAAIRPLQRWCHLDSEREAPLPIDDSDGGCDDWPRCKEGSPWKRQIAAIEIEEGDAITDSSEAYNLMEQRGIENVIVMGVHVNMCVLGRPFSIRQMVYQGKNVVLMRDMTDAMYNSRMAPYVSHFRGNELMIGHIERYWAPSVTSADLIGGEAFRFENDRPPRITVMVGEKEYNTARTLREFAARELEFRGYEVTFVDASPEDPNSFPDIESLKESDLLILSVRRRALPKAQLDVVREYVASGKPIVAIRTSSHAFDPRIPDSDDHAAWPEFDDEILGGDYRNHYGNKPPDGPKTLVRVVDGQGQHPALTGISGSLEPVVSHLYKNRNLAGTVTPLLEGRLENGDRWEPLAWINTANDRRVFYTSLGAPSDFATPMFNRLLLNGVLWALDATIPPAEQAADPGEADEPEPEAKEAAFNKEESKNGPVAAEKAAAAMTTPDDLDVELVLSEPIVRQPVFIDFDSKGRLWVVQYLQYPAPAGLEVVSRDQYWRAIYDKVPSPPPNHIPGADKITIHEDTDGDGVFDSHKVFVEGLNIATAVEQGRGGVWILNPPYLLFYPDADGDDRPDSDPEVHLAGFGLEDTHSVVNSLRWGPDGWLYAAQGSTVSGNIIRPGLDETPRHTKGQLIWRYHPETRKYEVFAEGGGNAFGVEIDSQGRIYSGHNGGNTRGFHYVQGGYFQKGFNKHGPLSNPHAYGYFSWMDHPDVQRFTHNFIIYEGGALPSNYDGVLFGIEPMQGRVVMSDVSSDGSTFKTKDIGYAVTTTDSWFRPVDIKLGPDGAIYFADWSDGQLSHIENQEGGMDKEHGRIFRLKKAGAAVKPSIRLDKLNGIQLAAKLGDANRWIRQEALRLIADRELKELIPAVRQVVQQESGQIALDSLWALWQLGGLDEDFARITLRHESPAARRWTVQLMADDGEMSESLAADIAAVAREESDPENRRQLAASARRLPVDQSFSIVSSLIRNDEDVSDPHIPLLIWWAIEARAAQHPERVVELMTKHWEDTLARGHLIERVMRRFAASGKRGDLIYCAELLNQAPDQKAVDLLMAGFEKALEGRSVPPLPAALVEAMRAKGAGSLSIAVRSGDLGGIKKALKALTARQGGEEELVRLIQALGEARVQEAVPVLLDIAEDAESDTLRQASFAALQNFDDPAIGRLARKLFPSLPIESRSVAGRLLASREEWARGFLTAVDEGKISVDLAPIEMVEQLRLSEDPAVLELTAKLWPQATDVAPFDRQLAALQEKLQSGHGDPYEGQKLYRMACGACHKLFGDGGEIGPDLSAYQRQDVQSILLNVVDPSAEIREGYENLLITTRDGRMVAGFLSDQDDQLVVVRGFDGQNISIPRDDISEMTAAGRSLMPEGLLDGMTDQQIRDLFAYLRSPQPLNN